VANLVDLIDELAETPEEMLDHLPRWVRILSEIWREANRQVNEDRLRKDLGRTAS